MVGDNWPLVYHKCDFAHAAVVIKKTLSDFILHQIAALDAKSTKILQYIV